jgi:hypothetical protein
MQPENLPQSIDTQIENEQPQNKKCSIKLHIIIITTIISLFTIFLSILFSNCFKDLAFSFYNFPKYTQIQYKTDSLSIVKELKQTYKKIDAVRKRLGNLTPAEPFMIVNSTQNTFTLRTRNNILRESICSTGSYIMLDAGDDQKWVFRTPKGMFRIQGKISDPVWIKPDWAFIEEGLPVPKKGSPERYEYGTLGDYAMSLGKGYLIHGTLYQRFLGMPVTHGCIRLGDDDLKLVYQNLDISSKVFIF